MKIFITGDSHTGALHRGAQALASTDEIESNSKVDTLPLGPGDALLKPFFVECADYVEITAPKCRQWVTQLPIQSKKGHYDFYGFSGPLHLQPVILHPFFSKHPPAAISRTPTAASTSLIRHIALERKRYAIDLVLTLKRLGVPVFVIEPPRTFRHHHNFGKVALPTITYLESFCRAEVKAYLRRHDVPVVELPDDSYDVDGIMLDKYRHENPLDHHHGNLHYGKMMIRKILLQCSI